MEQLEMIYFEIISAVGTARSLFIDAIGKAKSGDFKGAEEKIKEGNELFLQGHRSHSKLIQKEASDEKLEFSLILVHAEDQMMSAEAFKILAEEFIDIYIRFQEGR
ncbi:PTS lactose/cellobiose transporter subunit IIA [Clostridium sp. D2Q-14]|uniref:PTS lactose/cellobiose transporter subunit IIA n=1 Tax=Anaeromonas gelatinilytica TaxID=2683194 RepID=UPI00193C65CC|nr:PTS lactose/cellobiose transporter subunit IIA [Anaeromonas gelatinilytica]MBS4535452.1 PTS lactose/cellobiose transporter subunit IIA [Anaeromonas gelatinilytica]